MNEETNSFSIRKMALPQEGLKVARRLRREETWAEKLVWSWLRGRRFSRYKFRHQHLVGKYILDFYCERAKLNVELDGSQHGFPEQREHDRAREEFLQKQKIKTLRFLNSQLKENRQAVRDTIFRELQDRAPSEMPGYITRRSLPHP